MFKLIILLAVVYVVLKVINTRAKFAEADAKREAEEEQARIEQAEAEEAADIRASAIDVDAETEGEDFNDWSIEE